MAALELRPMSIGDILDTSFRLYRDRFGAFLTIVLLAYVPFGLLFAVFQTVVGFQQQQNPFSAALRQQQAFPQVAQGGPIELVMVSPQIGGGQFDPDAVATAPDPAVAIASGIGVFLFAVIVMPLCQGALAHNISAAYLNEELTAGQSYARAWPKLFRLLGASFLVGISVMFGVCLLVVGAVIFGLWFMLVSPIVMLEDHGAVASLGRSRELMRGNLGKGMLLGIVVVLIGAVFQFAVGFALGVVPWPHPFFAAFLGAVIPAVIVPVQLAPSVLLYYDIRIRKEAFDLNRLAEQLGRLANP
jgi:hypothetical protein